MNCDTSRDQLDDFIDDELEPHERKAVQDHLADCAACREEAAELRKLVALASKLPTPSAPSTFSGIAHQLAPRDTRPAPWRPLPLLAAAAALVIASSTTTAWLLQPEVQSTPATTAVSDDPLDALTLAVAELERSLAEKDLDPKVRELVTGNLEIIDRAIQETTHALESDPKSDFLRENLGKLKQQKVSILRRILNS